MLVIRLLSFKSFQLFYRVNGVKTVENAIDASTGQLTEEFNVPRYLNVFMCPSYLI